MATISILANTVRPSVDRRSDDTAFGAGTFSWQDPLHSWKAGPGEFMTAENLFIISIEYFTFKYPNFKVFLSKKYRLIYDIGRKKCLTLTISAGLRWFMRAVSLEPNQLFSLESVQLWFS